MTMTTITRDDYIAEFGLDELTRRCDRDGDGVEDAGVFDRMVQRAAAEVDGYVAARPAGVAAPAVALLQRVMLDVVRYLLFRNRMDEDVQAAYENAVSLLKSIASGRIAGAASSNAGSNSSAGSSVAITGDAVQFASASAVFSRANMADY